MRFSIVIPVYNVKDYLERCLDSVLANDLKDCEVIVVDDGSTDNLSPALCDSYAARYPDVIRVIHQSNMGLGGARNTGLEQARGDYVFFLDSDDTIVPDAMKILRKAVEQTPADIISFQLNLDDGQGNLTPFQADPFFPARPFALSDRKEYLLALPSAACRIWKRELFLASGVRYPSRVWYEDIRTSAKLFALAKSIRVLEDRLYCYLQRPGSIMKSAALDKNRDILEAFDDLLRWFREKGLYDTYKSELCRLAVDHIFLASTVRVARQDPRHPLLPEFSRYMQVNFPEFRKNPYLSKLPALHKLLLRLIEGGHYRTVRLLFRLKGNR